MHILPAYILCSLSSSQRGRRYAKNLVTLAVLIQESDSDPTHPQFLGTFCRFSDFLLQSIKPAFQANCELLSLAVSGC